MKAQLVNLAGLPGGDLVRQGLEDLEQDELSEAALLVLIAAPRLTALGIRVKSLRPVEGPVEHALYTLLEEKWGADAFSRYNGLIRRMVSFARALEREQNS
jgi:hypothetical protein